MRLRGITIHVEHLIGLIDQAVILVSEIENARQVSVNEGRNRIELQCSISQGDGLVGASQSSQEISVFSISYRFIRIELNRLPEFLFGSRKVPISPPMNFCQGNVGFGQ